MGALGLAKMALSWLRGGEVRIRARGDRARNGHRWDEAAAFYGRYLETRGDDAGIWVQRGNCLKEAGRLEEALASYLRAEALRPGDADVQLQLGHLAKVRGDLRMALGRYRRASELDPANDEAVREIDAAPPPSAAYAEPLDWSDAGADSWSQEQGALGARDAVGAVTRETAQSLLADLFAAPEDQVAWKALERGLEVGDRDALDGALRRALAGAPADAELLLELGELLARLGYPFSAREALRRSYRREPRLKTASALRDLGAPQAWLDRIAPREPRAPEVFFDLSDLLQVLNDRLTVTGIQRVQCNLIAEVLAPEREPQGDPDLALSPRPAFSFSLGGEWWRLENEDLADILDHVDRRGADDIEGRRHLIHLTRINAMRVEPQAGDTLVATGVAYHAPDLWNAAQALKQAGVRLGAILYDFIPLTHPDLADPVLTYQFSTAIADILLQLDFAVPISEFTAGEARRLMAEGGYPPIPIRAVPLAHAMRADGPGEDRRPAWRGPIASLKGEAFVLCVATYSAHKNQELLFNVWRKLIEEGRDPPLLVLVGHKAFGVEQLFRQLDATKRLGERIRLLEGLDDEQIATLYDACLFTVFPSKVEGWGLPVGESLAHGKVCVASDVASIPEAGGEFAIYIDPYDPVQATEVIGGLLADDAHRAFLERRLRSRFKVRAWAQYVADLMQAIGELTPSTAAPPRTLALAPGRVVKACAPSYEWDHGAALPPRDAQAANLARRRMLAEGWGAPETWGVWMAGSKARLRFTADAPQRARIVVSLHLRAAPWAKGNEIFIRSACGASTLATLPPAWSREAERSVPRHMVVTLDCEVGRGGEVDLTIEVLGRPAPSWWGEPRTLVLGLVRVMYLPAEGALVGLPPFQWTRPIPAPSAPRLAPMSASSLAEAMRGRIALLSGWRPDGAGRVCISGRRSSLSFVADARPGAMLRAVLAVARRTAQGAVGIAVSMGGGAARAFRLEDGEERSRLWVDGRADADGRVTIQLELIATDPADAPQISVESVIFGPRATPADRQRLTEALQLAAPLAQADDLSEALRASMRFVVAGHFKGSYSLAQINRRLALSLEDIAPGSVVVEQVEGQRTNDLADVPAGERGRLMRLAERREPDEGPVVWISQHWPIWSRPVESDLSLAFFHWEEGLVPRAVVTQLNNDFDGVLAPTRSVAKAITDSGVRRPVMVVGDGPDVDELLVAGAARAPERQGPPTPEQPFTFVHISSCFPRKGVDVLLKAWGEAFERDAPVRLVIKGFPNPHNDVEEQLKRLKSERITAPIVFVNQDLARESLDEMILGADCVVLPSRGEGFNLPALEALAAGVPVISTGFGGHVDFLDDRTARLVDYSFAQSQSHVASPGSTWAEPDPIDLAEALREAVAGLAGRSQAEAVGRGRRVARAVGDGHAWAERVREAALDLLRAPAPVTPKLAWISTWGIRCGVAQYAAMLLEHYPDGHSDVVVLCDGRTPEDALKRPDQPEARIAWDVHETSSVERLAAAIEATGADAAVIQHQPGLIRWPDLARLLRQPQFARREVILQVHSLEDLPPLDAPEGLDVANALRGVARVLVHTVRDLNALKDYGLVGNVALFPHGVTGASTSPAPARHLSRSAAPIIGSYGFFLPRKGIGELIRAFALIRRRWPKARLRLVNAEYPDVVSRDEIAQCQALARRLGVFAATEWRTEFQENDGAHQLLADCDLLVLPYQETKESASGAVRIALASGAPVAVTPIPIFEDIRPAAAELAGADPQSIADGIESLLQDRSERQRLQGAAAQWAAQYAWPELAARLAGLAAGLVATARVPGGADRAPSLEGATARAAGPAARAGETHDVPGAALRA